VLVHRPFVYVRKDYMRLVRVDGHQRTSELDPSYTKST
jgi:hypothetical protein